MFLCLVCESQKYSQIPDVVETNRFDMKNGSDAMQPTYVLLF